MRISLPAMLLLSLTLHLSVAGGITFSYFHTAKAQTAALTDITPPITTLIVLRSVTTSGLPQPIQAKRAVEPVVTTSPATPPSPVPPPVNKTAPGSTTISTQALALEANPNAHVRALPPEAVLSPSPAPNLDGTHGMVFILDVSGSMYEPYAGTTRLAFARETLSRQIRALKDGTPFAVTLYAQSARNSGPLVAADSATREAAVRFIMHEVDCGGGTNLPAGFASAQQLHAGSLVLVSDGDLNNSASDLASRALTILGAKGHCPSLTVIGIAPRPDKGSEQLMQSLADQEGGTYRTEQLNDNSELVSSASNVLKPAAATP